MNYQLLSEMVENSDLTKTQIASNLGVSRNTLDTILKGSPNTRVTHIEQICEMIQLNIAQLFDGSKGNVTAVGTHAKASGGNMQINSNNGNNVKLLLKIKELEGKLATAEALAEERKSNLEMFKTLAEKIGQ